MKKVIIIILSVQSLLTTSSLLSADQDPKRQNLDQGDLTNLLLGAMEKGFDGVNNRLDKMERRLCAVEKIVHNIPQEIERYNEQQRKAAAEKAAAEELQKKQQLIKNLQYLAPQKQQKLQTGPEPQHKVQQFQQIQLLLQQQFKQEEND